MFKQTLILILLVGLISCARSAKDRAKAAAKNKAKDAALDKARGKISSRVGLVGCTINK